MDEEEIIVKHTPLVKSIINKIYIPVNSSATKEDLFQAGCIGLLLAYRGYDKNKNTTFSTYAYNSIYRHAYEELMFYDNIRLVREVHIILNKLRRFIKENGEMTKDEMMTFIKKSVKRKPSNKFINSVIDSLDINNVDSFEKSLTSNIKLKDVLYNVEHDINQTMWLNDLIDILSNRSAKVIKMKYFYGFTNKQIGKEIGVSHQRVDVILKDSLNKLKKESEK